MDNRSIFYLNEIDTITDSDLIGVFDLSNGSERKASMSQLKTYMAVGVPDTQYSTPTGTGFSINANVGWLIVQPTGAFSIGSIVLPTSPSHFDEVSVVITQDITALSVVGSTVGAPTTITGGDFFTMRYDSAGQVWYRVA